MAFGGGGGGGFGGPTGVGKGFPDTVPGNAQLAAFAQPPGAASGLGGVPPMGQLPGGAPNQAQQAPIDPWETTQSQLIRGGGGMTPAEEKDYRARGMSPEDAEADWMRKMEDEISRATAGAVSEAIHDETSAPTDLALGPEGHYRRHQGSPAPVDQVNNQPSYAAPPTEGVPGIGLTDPLMAENYFSQTTQPFVDDVLAGNTASKGAVDLINKGLGQDTTGQELIRDDILPGMMDQGQASEYYDRNAGYAQGQMMDPVEKAARDRLVANRPDFEAQMEAGLDPYYDQQRSLMDESVNRQAAAMGLMGSTAEAEMRQQGQVAIAAAQAQGEATHQLAVTQEMRAYEESILAAAGQQGQAERSWFNDIGALSAKVEELGIMSASAAASIAGQMDRDEFNRLMESTSALQQETTIAIAAMKVGGDQAAAAGREYIDRVRLFSQTLMSSTGQMSSAMMGLSNQYLATVERMVDAYNSGDVAAGNELASQAEGNRAALFDAVGLGIQGYRAGKE